MKLNITDMLSKINDKNENITAQCNDYDLGEVLLYMRDNREEKSRKIRYSDGSEK